MVSLTKSVVLPPRVSQNLSRALSVGLDKTVRSWKVVEETQLMFRGGHDYSIDNVSMINEERWLTGELQASFVAY